MSLISGKNIKIVKVFLVFYYKVTNCFWFSVVIIPEKLIQREKGVHVPDFIKVE